MNSKQRKDKTRYKIRLSKAIKAQHGEYMFRLLRALNNMISLLSIRHCIDEGSLTVYQSEGTRSFVLDLEFGFLVEYLITFVEKVPKDVEGYFQQFPEVSSAFAELKSISATQDFAKLRSLRNNFIFHLNYQDEGKRTKKALSQLLKASARSKQVRQNANLVIRSTDPLGTRFVVTSYPSNVF